MAGHLTLNQVMEVRTLPSQPTTPAAVAADV